MTDPRGRSLNPNSRFQRAVALVRESKTLTMPEFTEMLRAVCETKEQMYSLRAQLQRRGAVEQIFRLKEPAA